MPKQPPKQSPIQSGDPQQSPRSGDPQQSPKQSSTTCAPAVILLHPQLGDNVGASVRAMLNGGLEDIRLVLAAGRWSQMEQRARVMAAGARDRIDAVRVFPDFDAACHGVQRLYAATARGRDANARVMTPRIAATAMRRDAACAVRSAIVFGPESSGFDNDIASRCDALIIARLNPAFRSLNLAQAVLLIAYEWWMAAADHPRQEEILVRKGVKPASREDISHFFDHLEAELDHVDFFAGAQQKPPMMRTIRTMFLRAGLLDREVRTLRGMISRIGRPPSIRRQKKKT